MHAITCYISGQRHNKSFWSMETQRRTVAGWSALTRLTLTPVARAMAENSGALYAVKMIFQLVLLVYTDGLSTSTSTNMDHRIASADYMSKSK
jgi:hypothetical protein